MAPEAKNWYPVERRTRTIQTPGEQSPLIPLEPKYLFDFIYEGVRRKRKSLSKASQEMGYAKSTLRGLLSRLDRHKTIPRDRTLIRIAKYLGADEKRALELATNERLGIYPKSNFRPRY